jgi:hypothetical protein
MRMYRKQPWLKLTCCCSCYDDDYDDDDVNIRVKMVLLTVVHLKKLGLYLLCVLRLCFLWKCECFSRVSLCVTFLDAFRNDVGAVVYPVWTRNASGELLLDWGDIRCTEVILCPPLQPWYTVNIQEHPRQNPLSFVRWDIFLNPFDNKY